MNLEVLFKIFQMQSEYIKEEETITTTTLMLTSFLPVLQEDSASLLTIRRYFILCSNKINNSNLTLITHYDTKYNLHFMLEQSLVLIFICIYIFTKSYHYILIIKPNKNIFNVCFLF